MVLNNEITPCVTIAVTSQHLRVPEEVDILSVAALLRLRMNSSLKIKPSMSKFGRNSQYKSNNDQKCIYCAVKYNHAQSVQTCYEAHPASYSVGTNGPFPDQPQPSNSTEYECVELSRSSPIYDYLHWAGA
jgi:hypothetical protein